MRPSLRYIDVCEILLVGCSFCFWLNCMIWSKNGGCRCRLNLSMFLLTISVGEFWSVQSVLEFSAIKQNLRIISDIERVF